MSATDELREFTAHVVDACNLHTASIFICDRRKSAAALKYLTHVGVPGEIQHRYLHGGVFRFDPFTDDKRAPAQHAHELTYCHELPPGREGRSADYWGFIDHFGIETVGASVRKLTAGVYSTIGFHHVRGQKRKGSVPLGQLTRMAEQLQDMATAKMLEILLNRPDGQLALMQPPPAAPALPQLAARPLSPREQQIAELVREGRLNKEIAWLTRLSEYTVENHLRRIYRKFGVHNRTALAAAMATASSRSPEGASPKD